MTSDATKYEDSEILSMAMEAFETDDSAKAEDLYNQVVLKVQKAFSNNQRDVAAELQRLSKCIEAAKNTDQSLTFKQRTCESMLKISMAERHKGKPAPVLAAPKPPLPFQNLDYLYVGSSDFERDVRFYKDTLKAELLWAFNKFGSKVAAFRLAYGGPTVMLADHLKTPSIEPIFSVSDLEASIKTLKARGVDDIQGPIDTPAGRACSFKDPGGNRYSLVQNDKPEAMERAYQDKSNRDAIRFD
jgi:predicted enzyme related to lactoylglutathione lyase